ncbi:hypothetical protein TSAR_015864, partial [Trichomalopsis sarcophagae]
HEKKKFFVQKINNHENNFFSYGHQSYHFIRHPKILAKDSYLDYSYKSATEYVIQVSFKAPNTPTYAKTSQLTRTPIRRCANKYPSRYITDRQSQNPAEKQLIKIIRSQTISLLHHRPKRSQKQKSH